MKVRVDLKTPHQVSAIIDQTGAKNFSIRSVESDGKITDSKRPPVYSYTGNNNKDAKAEFLFWSNLVLNGGKNFNPYSITLYNVSEEETTKKGQNSWHFIFTLSDPAEQTQTASTPQQITRSAGVTGSWEDQKQFIEMAIQSQFKMMQESDLNKRLAEIEKRLEDEEEEEEESQMNGQPSEMMQIIGMIAGMMNKGNPQPINGTEDQNTKLNKVLKRLHALDKNLVSDLEKLAEIGEKNPDQFNFLLNALRSM